MIICESSPESLKINICLSEIQNTPGSDCTLCSEGTFSSSSGSSSCDDCPSGQYSDEGFDACIDCDAGSQCLGGVPPTACPNGTYSGLGEDTCTPCPAGYHCVLTSNVTVECDDGTYSAEGEMTCTACSAGNECPNKDGTGISACPAGEYAPAQLSSCLPCSAGWYSSAGATACTKCEAGKECPNADGSGIQNCPAGEFSIAGASSCSDCAIGTYSLGGTSTCTICPAGSYCSTPSNSPALCAAGTFSQEGNSSCTSCGVGYFSDEGDTDCTVCAAGKYSTLGSSTCTTCNLGEYSSPPGTGCTGCPAGSRGTNPPGSTCTVCAEGKYSTLNSSTCTTCNLGEYSSPPGTGCTGCPAGSRGTNPPGSNCTVCAEGKYSTLGSSTCTTCNLGEYSSPPGTGCTGCPAGSKGTNPPGSGCTLCSEGTFSSSSGSSSCDDCPSGQYSDEGFDACVDCDAGSQCLGGVPPPTACPNGTYSGLGEDTCTPCPAGYHCVLTSNVTVECDDGTYSAEGEMTCTACSAGNECPNKDGTGISACLAGEYAPAQSSSCLPCSAGWYSSAGATSCTVCAAGKYSTLGSSTCPTCNLGEYSSPPGTGCTGCPAGSRGTNPPGSTCTVCAEGKYSTFNSSTCTTCNLGEYSSPPGTGCTGCPAGSRGANPPGSNCTACAAGTTSSVGAEECTDCPSGYHCLNPSSPIACTGGTYAVPTGGCLPCAAGTYSGDLADSCDTCPAGYACSGTSSTACVAGYYSEGGNSSCILCSAGYKCPGVTSMIPCASNEYSYSGALACDPCPAGMECPSPSATPNACLSPYNYSLSGDSFCHICPAGFECLSASTSPTACPSHEYSLGGDSAVRTCTACPAGMSCPGTDVEPTDCSFGMYSLYGSTDCDICPAGYSCLTTTTAPIACPDGTYSPESEWSCLESPVGYMCASPELPPVECEAGTFAASPNSTYCVPCPPGWMCPNVDGSGRIECTAGSYSEGMATSCTACEIGKFCPSTESHIEIDCPPGTIAATTGHSECDVCAAGSYCPDGHTSGTCGAGQFSIGGQSSCTICPAGYACPYTDSDFMIECTEGQYSIDGKTSCTVCPDAYSCPYTDQDITQPCTAGTYSAEGEAFCSSCPAGYECASSSGSSPSLCNDGYYSLGGQKSCTQCPRGFKCPQKDSASIPCPLGEYQDSSGQSDCDTCPGGYQCSNPAASPQRCSAGEYTNDGATECTPCDPGFYCSPGSTSPTPAGNECPAGAYCPSGNDVSVGYACPPGSFRSATGGKAASECDVCPAGYYCPTRSTGGTLCTSGHFCPEGTGSQLDCPSGTYNPSTGQSSEASCYTCPAGYYCPRGSGTPDTFTCPTGFFCPNGTGSAYQFPCPGGTFNPNILKTNESDCQTCGIGRYCPSGSSSEIECPIGTYQPVTGAMSKTQCIECVPGFACTETGMSTYDTYPCEVGHFCPKGTGSVDEFPCPSGTFTNSTSLSRFEDCHVCWRGYYCGSGTGGTENPPVACAVGHYCPGVPEFTYVIWEGYEDVYTVERTEFPCPGGTYTESTSLYASDQCTPCPAGYWCIGGGPTMDGLCSRGHYCPQNTTQLDEFECPPGTYMDELGAESVNECKACPQGNFCEGGMASPDPCPAGTYSEQTGRIGPGPDADTSGNECVTCVAGKYCPQGTVSPLACQPGEHTDAGADVCSACLPGAYCPVENVTLAQLSSTYKCPGGLYCPEGTSIVPTVDTRPCGVGQYCPAGISYPINCPPGYYSPSVNISALVQCISCDPGYYCLEGSESVSGDCAVGYYCESGSSGPEQEPCPRGTYRDIVGATSVDDCHDCPSGSYCDQATIDPVTCPLGHYCNPQSWRPTMCPIGTYGGSTGLHNSSECSQCDPGYYCDTPGLTLPRDKCDPGYYCILGAYTADPPGLPTGGLCPPGGYCVVGSSEPFPCDSGTYNNGTGGSSQKDCVSCTPGYYCAGSNNPFPTGKCYPGYYCDGGAEVPTQHITTSGTYTGYGESAPIPCPPGTYNTLTGQSECPPCPAGFYCPDESTSALVDCPVGHFCVNGSFSPDQCSPGTYNPYENAVDVSGCLPCPGGEYCLTDGLETPTGSCSVGFYCSGGSDTPEPTNDPDMGGQCPSGSYCPEGTTTPKNCPSGTYNPSVRSTSSSSCLNCTARYYCDDAGLSSPVALCSPGYYCANGAITNKPMMSSEGGGICPAGSFCVEGSTEPAECGNGKYANVTGMSECLVCPVGHYCEAGTVTPAVCSLGRYCPSGTGVNIPMCPAGTYSNRTGLFSEDECMSCPGGQFCGEDGLSKPSGDCVEQYYCEAGAITNIGGPSLDGVRGLCPEGYYCPSATAEPYACPAGTYGPSAGANAIDDCLSCPAGMFCDTAGLSAPSGNCSEGFYCILESHSPEPTDGVTGNHCAIGYYCPQGSWEQVPCPAGQYQNRTQQSSCVTCPAGHFCEQGCSSYMENECPAGHYCPAGTLYSNQYPCSAGTYNNRTRAVNVSSCLTCPPGYYCQNDGSSYPDGLCDGGYYCPQGSISRNSPGTHCLMGYYCPEGSGDMRPCIGGSYCDSEYLDTPTDVCIVGWYCSGSATSFSPADSGTGGVCPPGYYCPEESSGPYPCPAGTYSNSSGLHNVTQCNSCTPGYYCGSPGLVEPSAECHSGYYCPVGTIDAEPALYACPVGFYCPGGTESPILCTNGTYQDTVAQSSCKVCTAGYYCYQDVLSLDDPNPPRECPVGYFCPNGTGWPYSFPCPASSFLNYTGAVYQADCFSCTGGYYCEGEGKSETTGLCSDGYYCAGGAYVPNPVDGTTGDICPVGYYCARGSSHPTACPPGKWNNLLGQYSEEDGCFLCEPGWFCNTSGLSSDRVERCGAGYVCTNGSSSAHPTDYVHGYPCSPGHYCPLGSSVELNCEPGYYTSEYSQSSCLVCPAGKICSFWGTIAPSPCPTGRYCPGTDIFGELCPIGTFNNVTGISAEADCQQCSPGRYCPAEGLEEATALCGAGYHCASGAMTAFPDDGTNMPCPIAHYCPEGISAPLECPPGTFSNSTGLNQVGECVQCTPSRVCGGNGLNEPDGYCAAGYYCPEGQTTSTPSLYRCPVGHYCPAEMAVPISCPGASYQDLLGQSTCKLCPRGFYCPENSSTFITCPLSYYCVDGTEFPEPCPDGFYGNVTGIESSSSCAACPAGKYCLGGVIAADCSPGYICYHSCAREDPDYEDPRGGLCPKGHYCLEGVVIPTACNGTLYNPTTGGSSPSACIPCPAGYECLPGDPIPHACPVGHYCPISTAPVPCPIRSYNNITGAANIALCLPCVNGYYSPIEGLDTYERYPCTPGNYCPSSVDAPVPCPAGRNRSSVGGGELSDCALCPGGHYCVEEETTPPTCPAGSYCPLGSSEPLDCPSGTYCPEGSELPLDCNEGSYCPNNTNNQIPCPARYFCPSEVSEPIECPGRYFCSGQTATPEICTEGYYCPTGSSGPLPCPAKYYCPTGSITPLPCVPGFYCPNISSVGIQCEASYYCPTLSEVHNECPAGYYCPGGTAETFLCPGGHYCPALTSVPIVCNTTYYCPNGSFVEIKCPAGYYCPQGSASPLGCPLGRECRDRDQPYACPGGYMCDGLDEYGIECPSTTFCPIGSSTQNDCPAGYYCPAKSVSPLLCTAGFYCPNTTWTPVSCPATKYCEAGAVVPLTCPPKYYCPEETGTPQGCEAGYYCPVGSEYPIECPAGYSCPALSDHAEPCPPGYYCPNGAPLLCEGGNYCPTGSQYKIQCPATYSCPPGSSYVSPCPPSYECPGRSTPIACPGNYYCSNNTEFKHSCPIGYYCPAGATEPTMCPAGTHLPLDSVDRSSLSSCLVCPPGTYGALENRTECLPCTAGYVCLGRTTVATPTIVADHNGYKCPKGAYCPESSSREIECTAGRYNAYMGKASLDDCIPCVAGSYNPRVGQSTCLPCGASSYSIPGDVSCRCNGTNRAYQQFDGNCICEPRYVFYSEELTISDEDSSIDCQPIVYERCSSDYARNYLGKCVSLRISCSDQCISGSGSFNPSTGVCDCANVQDEDTVCDEVCRLNERQIYVDQDRGLFALQDPGSNTVYFNFTAMQGEVNCRATGSGASCPFRVTHCYSEGFRGVYDGSDDYYSALLREGEHDSGTDNSTSARAFDWVVTAAALPAGIDQPVTCLRKGEGMLWSVSADKLHFPVYEKDSLYNTNPTFDYGLFRELEQSLQDPNADIATFAFTFNEEGVYVFSDSANSDRLQFIRVLGDNEDCPRSARFLPLTSSNLVAVGARRTDDILLEPDWILIAILLAGLVVLIGGLIAGLYYFRKKTWGRDAILTPEYRENAKAHDFENYASKGAMTKRMQKYQVSPEEFKGEQKGEQTGGFDNIHMLEDDFWDYERQVDLEGFSVKKLYDILQNQTSDIAMKIAKQSEDAGRLYQKVFGETEQLKDLLATKLDRRDARRRKTDTKEETITPEQKTKALDDEIATREVYERREDEDSAELAALYAQLTEEATVIEEGESLDPQPVRELIEEIREKTVRIRENMDQERKRRDTQIEDMKDVLGIETADILVGQEVREREVEEKYVQDLEENVESINQFLDNLKRSESEYKRSKRTLSGRDPEALRDVELAHAYKIAGQHRDLADLLGERAEESELDKKDLAQVRDHVKLSRNQSKNALKESILKDEADKSKEKEDRPTFDLPLAFGRTLLEFLGRALNEMGLLSEEQLSRLLLDDNTVDLNWLRELLDARNSGKPVGIIPEVQPQIITVVEKEEKKETQPQDYGAEAARLMSEAEKEQMDRLTKMSKIKQDQLALLEKKMAENRARLLKNQEKEKVQAKIEIKELAKEEETVQEEQMKTEKEIVMSIREEELKQKLEGVSDEDERNRIMSEYNRERDELEKEMELEARRQRERLQEKLAKKRQRKMNSLEKKHENELKVVEEVAHQNEETVKSADDTRAKEGEQLLPVEIRKELLDNEFEANRKAMEERHAEEMKIVDEESKEELEQENSDQSDRFEMHKTRELERLSRERDFKLASASNDDEASRIMAEYEEEKSRLENRLDLEKTRQNEALKQAMMKKMQAKREKMTREQIVERETHVDNTEDALKDLLSEHQKDEEKYMKSLSLAWRSQQEALEKKMKEKRERRMREQEVEEVKVEAELENEERESVEQLEAKSQKKKQEQMNNLQGRMKKELDGKRTESEKQRIIEEYNEQQKQLEANWDNEKARQMEELRMRIQKKRRDAELNLARKREREMKEEFEAREREMAAIRLSKATKSKDDAEETPLFVPAVPLAEQSAEEQALKRRHDAIKQELEAKGKAEEEEVKRETEKETQKEERREAKRIEEKAKRQLAEQKGKLSAQLDSQLAGVTDENEANRIMEQHNKEVESLEGKLDVERSRQKAAIKKKLEAKKRRKQREVALKHEEEERKELERQQREEQEVHSKLQKELEMNSLQQAIEAGQIPDDRVEEAIEIVLQQRHAKETQDMIREQRKERVERVDLLQKQLRNEFSDVMKELDIEFDTKLLSTKGSAVSELRKSFAQEKKKKEEEFQQQLSEAKSDALLQLDVQFAQDRMELRRRQLDEIVSACEDLSPEQALLRVEGLEAQKRRDELLKFKEKLEQDKAEERKKMEAERQRLEQEQKAKVEKEMEQLRKEFEEEKERIEKQLMDKRSKKDKELEDIRKKKKNEMQKELEGATNEQKNEIMERYAMEQAVLDRAVSGERERQGEAMREKIRKKQERKMQIRQRKLEAEYKKKQAEAEEEKRRVRERYEEEQRVEEERQRQEELKRQEEEEQARMKEEEEKKKKEDEAKLEEHVEIPSGEEEPVKGKEKIIEGEFVSEGKPTLEGKIPPSATPALRSDAPPADGVFVEAKKIATEEEWFDVLKKSPLYSKLVEIDGHMGDVSTSSKSERERSLRLEQMRQRERQRDLTRLAEIQELLTQRGTSGGSSDAQSGVSMGEGYRDRLDMQYEPEGFLDFLDEEQLSMLEFVVYKFGIFVVGQISDRCGQDNVNVLLAKKLPNSGYAGNAFRNSYYFDEGSKTLFIRQQRLSSIGDFVLVLLHAVAHIWSGSMEHDRSPGFQIFFHRCLRCAAEDLFLSRSHLEGKIAAEGGDASESLKTVLDREGISGRKGSFVRKVLDTSVRKVEDDVGDAVSRVQEYEEIDKDSKRFFDSLKEQFAATEADEPQMELSRPLEDIENELEKLNEEEHDVAQSRLISESETGDVDVLSHLKEKDAALRSCLSELSSEEVELTRKEEEYTTKCSSLGTLLTRTKRKLMDDEGDEALKADVARIGAQLGELLQKKKDIVARKTRVVQRVGAYESEISSVRETLEKIEKSGDSERMKQNKDFYSNLLGRDATMF